MYARLFHAVKTQHDGSRSNIIDEHSGWYLDNGDEKPIRVGDISQGLVPVLNALVKKGWSYVDKIDTDTYLISG